MHELGYALRTLRKNPAFAGTAIATLALAIAANVVMFSVLDAVILRPLPFRSPEQLVMLWAERPDQSVRQARSPYVEIEEWRRQSRSLSEIAVMDPVSVTLTAPGDAERMIISRVSPNFFPLLGVQPAYGRAFSSEEGDRRERVVVISHRLWMARFGGVSNAIGAPLTLDGQVSRVVGILPPAFRVGPGGADIFEPHTIFPDWDARRAAGGPSSWMVIARLRPGVGLEAAQSEMTAIARRLDEQRPAGSRGRDISLVPLDVVGASSRVSLWMLTGAVFCVLLIAATNVASLSVARGIGRAREMAVRSALGATTGRLVRQMVVESLTLAGLAGGLGAWMAAGGLALVRVVGPRNLPRLGEASIDPTALSWALVITIVTGVVLGIVPALATLDPNSRQNAMERGRGMSAGVGARRIRRSLVVAEVALAILLLVGASLLVRSWWQLERVDPGFRAEDALSMAIAAPAASTAVQRAAFFNQVLEQVQAVPGVQAAGVIGDLFVGGAAEQLITAEGGTTSAGVPQRLRRDEVSDGFFTAAGATLLHGRSFAAGEGSSTNPVAVVNETMARRLWPEGDAVGGRFKLGAASTPAPWFTVVGVVGDMRRQGLENAPIAQIFEPLAQNPGRLMVLIVRPSVDDPLRLVPSLREAVGRVDAQALYGVTTLEAQMGERLAARRFQTSLLIAFSLVALLMAAIGIYGISQYAVSSRTREIGIRLAIGAQKADVVRMVVSETLRLTAIGLGLGLAGASWLSHAGASLLFNISPTDPVTFAAVSLLLATVAAVACYFPARRAMRVDPIVALRQE